MRMIYATRLAYVFDHPLTGPGKEDDLALAQEVTDFVAAMPPAVSRRLQRAREIMMADRAQGGSTDRSIGPTGVNEPGREDPKPRDRER